MNLDKIESLTRELLFELGYDVSSESNKDLVATPRRVAKSWAELLTQQDFSFTEFEPDGYEGIVVQKDIRFYSLCRHHLLPFYGSATLAYIARDKIVGLSKLARTVEIFSHRLQTQEYMTQQIGLFLEKQLNPLGVGVSLSALHLCESMRGVKKDDAITVTTYLSGIFKDDASVKDEFYRILENKR